MTVPRSPIGRAGAGEGAVPQGEGDRPRLAPGAAGRAGWTRRWEVSRWPAPAAAAVCGLLLALIGFVDLRTGPELMLAPYYLLPIIIASLRFRRPGGLSVALASAVLSAWPSPVAMRLWEHPRMFAANAITHTLMFSFVALVTGGLQTQRERLRRQREALQQAHGLLQDDLRAAAALQRHLLSRPLPETPGLELAAEIRFARGVGGDFYDLRRDGRSLAICVADVSGKGARAALISAALRALIDEVSDQGPDPMAFLHHLNARLVDDLPDEMFVTMFYGQLDLENGELRYASAGHDPPFLCRGDRVETLEPTAPALGMLPELSGQTERAVLRPGDMLLLYTDGLTTARLPSGGRVGEERVMASLPGCAATPPAVLVSRLLGLACPPEAALEDDIAVIALRPRRGDDGMMG